MFDLQDMLTIIASNEGLKNRLDDIYSRLLREVADVRSDVQDAQRAVGDVNDRCMYNLFYLTFHFTLQGGYSQIGYNVYWTVHTSDCK